MRKGKMPSLGGGFARAWAQSALVVFTLVVISSLTPISWARLQYKTLHIFRLGGRGGYAPSAGLVADLQGNLYGTTAGSGNTHGYGTVFELAPNGHGGWRETVLHSFNFSDGSGPWAALIFDSSGNLYGTTLSGGAHGLGTVFELAPDSHGGWNETALHSFNGTDGQDPLGRLIFDAAGNLYGTTWRGGTFDRGTVFQLAPDGHSGWKETVLYSFTGADDGDLPTAGLIFDASGHLYGTTSGGGTYEFGTVFELAPDSHGGWNETVLHSFAANGTGGSSPLGDLIFDASGNLYGTTLQGGVRHNGTAFELAPDGHGDWTETVLHPFNGTDGQYPVTGLIFDSAGNLYGTTQLGGASGYGTVFQLTPRGNGEWKETILHSFKDRPGADPLGSLIFDKLGHLYGTTFGAGQTFGSVFEITP